MEVVGIRVVYEFEPEEIRRMIQIGLIVYGMSDRHLNTFSKRRKFQAEFTPEEQGICKELAQKAARWDRTGLKGTVQMTSDELTMWNRLSVFCIRVFGGR